MMLSTTTAMAAASPPALSPCLSCSNARSITPRVNNSFPCGGKMKMISEKTTTTKKKNKRSLTVVAAAGEVSADSTNYLIAGAAAITLLGTAFPIIYSRKDLCPECDGAGFVRQSSAALRANAARKDQAQIVCPRCNGLGKLNQIDK